jgi:adenosine deaminase
MNIPSGEKKMPKELFIQSLINESHEGLTKVPKSDLHNHAGRGGNPFYIENILDVKMARLTEPLNSLDEMQKWFDDNIKCHFPDKNGWIQRVAAAFIQAKEDNITVLALSYSIGEVYCLGSLDVFTAVMDGLHRTFIPETLYLPDLTLCGSNDITRLDEIFNANWFKGVDINNCFGNMSMDDMKAMSRKAHEQDLVVKAHVGEFDGADDVMRYVEELGLDQIQHGIAAVGSPQIMNWLAKHKIQLNICPTSNILLSRTKDYESHQIRTLFDYGIPVTINNDDLLIFNSTVSQEYLNLYNAGLMTADELNIIRETGLSSAK